MAPEELVEVTALSVDEAVILGLTRMGVTRDEVDIEVLDEGSRGFLGLGAREARVRLTRRAQQAVVPDALTVEKPSAPPEPLPDVAVAEPAVSEPEPKPEDVEPVAETAPDVAAAVIEPAPEESAEEEEEDTFFESSEVSFGDLDRESIEKAALDVAENLFPDLRVKVFSGWRQEDRPTLWLSVRGRDANLLVGPRAQTLSAVQYLFRTLVHRRVDGNYNLVVDADGYRKRRHRSLESLAHKKADQAVSSGRTLRLRPMPAHERRVVHMVLRKDERVQTESVGRGSSRAITIIPVKKARG